VEHLVSPRVSIGAYCFFGLPLICVVVVVVVVVFVVVFYPYRLFTGTFLQT